MDREVVVYADVRGKLNIVRRLWWRSRKDRESASFEYEKRWLTHRERFSLEPALRLGPGPFHTQPGAGLFGAIGDSAPDRWGRILMRRAEQERPLAAPCAKLITCSWWTMKPARERCASRTAKEGRYWPSLRRRGSRH